MWDRVDFAEVKIQRAKGEARAQRQGSDAHRSRADATHPPRLHLAHGSPDAGPVFPVTKGERKGEHRKERGTSYAARLRLALCAWASATTTSTTTPRRPARSTGIRSAAPSLPHSQRPARTSRRPASSWLTATPACTPRYVQQTRAMRHIPSAAVPLFGAFALPPKGHRGV